ncbi:DMT family transporter [Leifsonia virtsii]|uniref:DMT family transporter n=1 Tax=Leifsonia virtsii TaxID=3035915 RepID=A0ABT8IWW6_9MICO|nr:DMT family transporter [Leifsonia virtsii]MDN4596852.1 DMT family transporter [Leifsonia virtsii]
MKANRGVLAGLAVVVLWASAFPAIQVAAPAFGVIGLSFVRLAVAMIALLAFAAVKRVRLPRPRDLGWIVAAGFFGMTAYQLLLNESELHVPAGTASIIVAAAPLVSVAVAFLLFREPVTRFTVVGSLIALAGVAVVCLARAGVSLSASVWIVVAAMVVQGIYHPLQRPLLKTYSGLEVATYTMVAGTAMTLPLVPFGWGRLVEASPTEWIAAVYLGLLPSALGFVLWGYAVGRLPVAISTSLLYLVPPIAVFIAWVWLGEIPLPAELVGGLIVIAGVVVISQGARLLRRARRRQPATASAGR